VEPPKLDPAEWPTDSRTLRDLIEKLTEVTPLLDQKVADVLSRAPDLTTSESRPDGTAAVTSYRLGRIVAISILDFLCWAYDRPELGYTPAGPGPGDKAR